MQKHLIRQLHEGRFEAFGVMIRPEIGRQPQKIPEFIFDKPKVRWGAGTIENFGQKFEGVRVRRAVTAVASDSPIRTERISTGRPSKAVEINEAIRRLKKRGVRLDNMPRDAAYDAIRKFAKNELNANIERGYSDPVIQRCLVRMIGKRS
jgi:hypothetical protein